MRHYERNERMWGVILVAVFSYLNLVGISYNFPFLQVLFSLGLSLFRFSPKKKKIESRKWLLPAFSLRKIIT